MLADELLGVVRHASGVAGVEYAEPPVRFTGGFYTENHGFRLAGASPPWDGPLVVRLFPSSAPADQAHREVAVQRVLADQGYPAPGVVFFDDAARLTDRHFFVMDRLPGKPMLGGIRARELIGSARGLFRRLVEVTASSQAWLQRLDAAPLVTQLASSPPGIERWFAMLRTQIESTFDGLARGLEWLEQHRPPAASRPVICHGDLWPGNILTEGDRLTGVLDYTVATVAEPALEVGFTAMSFRLLPIDLPAPLQKIALRVAGSMCDRYIERYVQETDADLVNQPYYEALRCASELTGVVTYRTAIANGQAFDAPRPTWDSIADRMIEYFRARTGVTLTLPPPV